MAVYIGSARSDERGKITGGKAGDQTSNEVSYQNWYLHSKGWIIIRAKKDDHRKKIAKAMKAACDNNYIGYDQNTRLGLYNAVKNSKFDPAKCNKKVNTDCSALVRVCVHYAGITCNDFNTASEVSVLKSTGKFDIITDPKYTKTSNYLKQGDILVTATKGHTVVVLTDGQYSNISAPTNETTTSNGKTLYYPKYTGTSTKIDIVFKAIGAPNGNVKNRTPVANKNGISNYTGTSDQNLSLISLAKRGKLKK